RPELRRLDLCSRRHQGLTLPTAVVGPPPALFRSPMKTRSEVGTTSSLEFFHRKGRKSGRFGDWGWGPKRAGARGSSQRFTSRRSRSTPSGDRRRRSPFRSSDLPVTHLRARLVDTARCLSREPVFTDSRWSEVPDGLPATDPSRTRLAERSGFFRFLELQAG